MYKVVNPNGAVIRESTDAKSAKIGKLAAGDIVGIAHIEDKYAQLVGGGFVIASTIEPSDSTETTTPPVGASEAVEAPDAAPDSPEDDSDGKSTSEQRQGTVNCDGYKSLNVRQEPSQQAAVVAELADRTPVIVEETSDDGAWYRVDCGWVMAAFVIA